ncbi:MAG: beta-lactamase family protein [Bacteroidia bacterium]|nr:beta-lactamase family protein [Bacteroidia bacterium]
MKKIILLSYLISSFCSLLLAQNGSSIVTPESVGISSERLEKLDAVMTSMVDEGKIAGVQTAISRKGKLIHYNTYGKSDLESNSPLSENSLWRIYSMTKPIASVGLMMLYEDGKFQLNDPLEKYLPEFKEMQVYHGDGVIKPAMNQIKVIDILRHTTGLGYGWSGGYVDSLYAGASRRSAVDNAAFTQALVKLPLYSEPSTGWRYSVSTDVVGRLIEVLSGMSLDQYLSQKILGPLKMEDTFFEVPDEKEDRFVTTYAPKKEGGLRPIDHPSTSRYTKTVTMFSAGGGMVSTTDDYLRFCQMLLNGGILDGARILSPKTIELMTKDHCKDIPYAGGPVVLPAPGKGFGLGFSVVTDLADTGILGSEGTYGWGGAAGTFFRIDPEEDLIYIMMIQLMPNNHLQASSKFQTMVYQAIID